MNTEKAKATGWTETDEKVIAALMEKTGCNRMAAIRKMKNSGVTPAHLLEHMDQFLAAHKAEKPATKKAKAPKAERKSKYNKDAVIAAWDRGRTPVEIAALETPGIKGISLVYVHRILFGQENSGGVSKEQSARRKEAERREKQAKAEREKEEKANA